MLNSNGGEMKQPMAQQPQNLVGNMIAGLPLTPGMVQPQPMQPQPVQAPQPIPPPANFQQQPPQYQPSANMNAPPSQPNDMNQVPNGMNSYPQQPMGMHPQPVQPPQFQQQPPAQPTETPGCNDDNQGIRATSQVDKDMLGLLFVGWVCRSIIG